MAGSSAVVRVRWKAMEVGGQEGVGKACRRRARALGGCALDECGAAELLAKEQRHRAQ